MNIHENGLGRLIVKDENDHNYLIKSILPKAAPTRTSRYWYANGWWGDQGSEPQCVGYSWAHWVEDGPVTQAGVAPIESPVVIYKQAQLLDAFPGQNYEGTTVRAGAKHLQSRGYISTYLWAWDLHTLVEAVLEKGPVVVGTYWYYDMFTPDAKGLIKVSGAIAGGHAYLINGVNTKTRLFRIKNSWGKSWGVKGHAYISFDDMEKLIKQDGEICLAIELKK